MQIRERVQPLADEAIKSYNFPADARATLISISENMTFLVENDAPLGVLRLYRAENQSVKEIKSELMWINSLVNSDLVNTPSIIETLDGSEIGTLFQDDVTPRHFVMFEHVAGEPPAASRTDIYEVLGTTVALLHEHVTKWSPPSNFERSAWNVETILGRDAPWGNWRNGPGVTNDLRAVIEKAEARLIQSLEKYQQTAGNSGLVHGDLREANLLMDEKEALWVIDYDDCGFSWYLWDLGSSTSFIENLPSIGEIVDAWLSGYSQVRQFTARDLRAVVDIVFLRRLHLLAWMGSHPDGGPVHEFGDDFASGTAEIARAYMNGTFLEASRWVREARNNR